MSRQEWTSLSLDDFEATDDLLASVIPGDTPGQRADSDALHEIFHEQTKQHRTTSLGLSQTIRAHVQQPGLVARCVRGRHRRQGAGIGLPEPDEVTATLVDALARRVSIKRENLAGAITAEKLSTLLYHSARVQRSGKPKAAPELTQYFRPYPSAGALYPCEIYLAVSAVEGLPSGMYRYDGLRHDLVPCRRITDKAADFSSAEVGASDVRSPACALIITSVFERAVRKYGSRGYRLALIEAGHILQNLSLVATSLDLGTLVSASFYEAELERLIDVDGVSEAVLASFLIGNGAASTP